MKRLSSSPSANRILRTRRYFSEPVRRSIVQRLERRELSVAQAARLYEISRSAIYKWLHRYSASNAKGTQQVVQMESESHKTLCLQDRLAQTEQALGRKQMEVDLLEELLRLASEELGYDVKKKLSAKRSKTGVVDSAPKHTP
jgi:transposase-like protein